MDRGDFHSARIAMNRSGILRCADSKEIEGRITLDQRNAITELVEKAAGSSFVPLLYVIPGDRVRKVLMPAPYAQRAATLSAEFVIPSIKRSRRLPADRSPLP